LGYSCSQDKLANGSVEAKNGRELQLKP
jgi:hypothetical protein